MSQVNNLEVPNLPLRTVKSYVCRARVTQKQRKALDNYWPVFGVESTDQVIDFKNLFNRTAPTMLEIGFGMGKSLLEFAKSNPEINFIGIDVHMAGIGAVLSEINDHHLTNIRLFKKDAIHILQNCISNESLDAVLLFFPDPWPKKRHQKRRIVQPNFVNLVHSKLQPGAYFHLATDIEEYAEQMIEVVNCHGGFHNHKDQIVESRHLIRPKTKFELRGERKGHTISDLVYLKR
jgi:tRNA (guanine-N7-)-methyltransferase